MIIKIKRHRKLKAVVKFLKDLKVKLYGIKLYFIWIFRYFII